MIIAHGTSVTAMSHILQRGLKPRGEKNKGNWDNLSRPDAVYLTQSYAFHYAMGASKDGNAAIIEVDIDLLDKERLIADENAIEQAFRSYAINYDIRDATAYHRDRLIAHKYAGFDHLWSLEVIGNMAVIGEIPVSAIKRVVVIENCMCPEFLAMFDPSINIINFQIMGAYYENLQAMMLGRTYDEEAFYVFGNRARKREAIIRLVTALTERRRVIHLG